MKWTDIFFPLPSLISRVTARGYTTVVANGFSDDILVRVSDNDEDILKEKFGFDVGVEKVKFGEFING